MALTRFDSKAARKQGWSIFDNDVYGTEIERIDAPDDGSEPVFANDHDAIQFVQNQAANGDANAQTALAVHQAGRTLYEFHQTQRRDTQKTGRPCRTHPAKTAQLSTSGVLTLEG